MKAIFASIVVFAGLYLAVSEAPWINTRRLLAGFLGIALIGTGLVLLATDVTKDKSGSPPCPSASPSATCSG